MVRRSFAAVTRRGRSAALVGVATVLGAACAERVVAPTGPAAVARTAAPLATATPSLRAAAAAKGRFYGCAVGGSLFSDDAFRAAAAAECGMLVPENALKWGTLRPAPTPARRADAAQGGMAGDDGGANQRFALPAPGAAGEIRVYGALCLDAESGNGNDGDRNIALTHLILWPCRGGSNQQWDQASAGAAVARLPGV